MICRKCKADVPDGPYCLRCGAKQAAAARNTKSRGNGQGSVYRLPNGKYKAIRVQMYLDETGKSRRRTVSRTFARKKDAVDALPLLDPSQRSAAKVEKKRHRFPQQKNIRTLQSESNAGLPQAKRPR